jgi:transcriptional regulator with XRE-family HTH domain
MQYRDSTLGLRRFDSRLAIIDGMSRELNPARLVRDARSRAGLSQRELARRACTSQSVVARVEGGRTQPSSETLARLLAGAGFELRAELVPRAVRDTHMLGDVSRILALTPEDRLREVGNVSRFEAEARRA